MTDAVVGLDLAAVYSAHVGLDSDGGEVCRGSSWHFAARRLEHQRPYLRQVAEKAADMRAVLVCEDVPPIPRYDLVTKNVTRLQGELQLLCEQSYPAGILIFVMPRKWQTDMDVWKKTSAQTEARAVELGFTPPDVLGEWDALGLVPALGDERKAARAQAKKIRTDVVDAYLIALWGRAQIMDKGVEGTISQKLVTIG